MIESRTYLLPTSKNMNRTCPNQDYPTHQSNSPAKISPYGYYKTKAGKRRRFRCQVCRTCNTEIHIPGCLHCSCRINLAGKTRLNTAKRNRLIRLPSPNEQWIMGPPIFYRKDTLNPLELLLVSVAKDYGGPEPDSGIGTAGCHHSAII